MHTYSLSFSNIIFLTLVLPAAIFVGCSSSSPTESTQTKPNSWTTASSAGFTPREFLSSSVVNGKIFVIGGASGPEKGTAVNTLEVFDPSTNTWSTPVTTGSFTRRRSHTSTVVNGKIYVIGGVIDDLMGQVLNTVEVFDPATNAWTTLNTTGTFTPRFGHVSEAIGNKIYVIGGENSGPLIETVDVFDLSTNSWSTPVTTGIFNLNEFFTSNVIADKIYVMGGIVDSLQIFDPSTNNWSTPKTTGTFTPRYGLTSSVFDNKIYTFDGVGASLLNTLEVFDPSTNTWTTPVTTGTSTARYFPTSSTVSDNIYVIGGRDTTGNQIEVFTP